MAVVIWLLICIDIHKEILRHDLQEEWYRSRRLVQGGHTKCEE